MEDVTARTAPDSGGGVLIGEKFEKSFSQLDLVEDMESCPSLYGEIHGVEGSFFRIAFRKEISASKYPTPSGE